MLRDDTRHHDVSKFTNDNLFVLQTNLSLTKTATEAQFQNNGNILVPAESGVRSMSIDWSFTNRGAITAGTNSVLELRPANDKKNGFVPASGDTFGVVNYDSFTGQLFSTQLPTLPDNLSWEVDYGPTAVALKVVSCLNVLSIANPVRLTGGNLRLDVAGTASDAMVIQATTNLTLPDTWLNVATNAPFSGRLSIHRSASDELPTTILPRDQCALNV